MFPGENAMRAIRCAILAAVLVIGAAAHAGTPVPYEPRQAFAEADRDHNGVISRQELCDRAVEVLYSADANKDGFLSVEELALLPHQGDLAAGDANHDGRLSVDEYVRLRDLEFEDADRDKDGVLTVEEVVAAYEVEGRR
jgi:Ca2+-binding EF-hand superfamily protein